VKAPIAWDNRKLEPVLITYNRSADLQRTLTAFLEAGLTDIRLHVLDNASTDETASVVAAAQVQWPNLTYHRNQYNIGGNANILRAVEITSSEYSWILGDDDDWHLDDIRELRLAVEDGRVDLIRLGWLSSEASKGKALPAIELAENEKMFFASMSQITNVIIRRSVFIKYLPQAYMNLGDAFPHLVPTILGLSQDSLVLYTISNQIMTYKPSTEPSYYFGDLVWHNSWFRTSRFVQSDALRKKFLQDGMDFLTKEKPGLFSQFVLLLKISLKFKSHGVKQGGYLLSMFAYGEGWRFRLAGIIAIYSLLPIPAAKALRHIHLRLLGRQDKGLHIDRSRL
jgi:glycosyltransferase involved in cell wall biosynthesis